MILSTKTEARLDTICRLERWFMMSNDTNESELNLEDFESPNVDLWKGDWEEVQSKMGRQLCVIGFDLSTTSSGWALLCNGWFVDGGVIKPPKDIKIGNRKMASSSTDRIIYTRDEVLDLFDHFSSLGINIAFIGAEAPLSGRSASTAQVPLTVLAGVVEIAIKEHLDMGLWVIGQSTWRSKENANIGSGLTGVTKGERRSALKARSVSAATQVLDFNPEYCSEIPVGDEVADVADACWIAAVATKAFCDAALDIA